MAGAYTCSVATHRIEVPGNSEGIGVDTLVGSPAIGNFTVEGVCDVCVRACVLFVSACVCLCLWCACVSVHVLVLDCMCLCLHVCCLCLHECACVCV